VTPILATKLYLPRLRPNVVSRPRLLERLNEGLHRNLTLISAPAGFGKTTLVSEWVALIERATAWLSLDEGENDPTRFLTYLVAALQTIAPNIGEGMLGVLQSSQPPPPEAILTALLNEITTLPDHFVLVLDDYHVIDAKAVDQALTYLVEHLPPQMHLVIATREDPQLPLARLRARGHLIELRAADLRFTASEAAEFLNQVMGLSLSAADIAALEDRTEGWIAGLQLAALSMQRHQDVPGFIRAFAGDHRYIVDYLVEEVLQRQPEPVRSFLLQTAILDRLNGPLCDAVTGQEEGNARLEALERGNFFVVPLDDKRHWYRYHHLFAEVLSAHLMAEQPDQVSTLHRRASAWYEQNDLPSDAIRHALAAKDFERAADLIERAVPAMRRSRQEATVLGWLQALPDELLHYRPVLSVHYAGTLLLSGELEGVEARLRDAERWLDTKADMGELVLASSAEMVVVDEEEFLRLPGSIAVYRAASALALGDVADTVKYARRALDLLPEEEHLGRGAAAGFLGLAYWTSGDLEAAHRSYTDCMARVQRAGHISDAIGCSIALADIRIAQGRLHEAMRTYEQALQLATAHGEPVLRGTADMYVGMSELHREQNDLHAATQLLLRSKELGELTGLPQNRYRWCEAQAGIREAQGDLDGALDLLHEAERLYVSDFFPNVRPIAAGALYLLTFVSIPTLALYGPVHEPNYIVGPGPDTAVIFGGVLEIIVALAGIGTAVALYPVVKRQNEGVALGFVGARVLEAGTIFAGVVSLLAVVTLRQAGAGADALVTGQALVALHDWFRLGQSLLPAVNALLLGSLMYQSRLVPRVLPLLGLIGAPLLVASTTATMFGIIEPISAWSAIAALPIALWELSLGVWLIAKGFNPSAITSESA
jgi:LuxR family maltose regulon positive regulatory protein